MLLIGTNLCLQTIITTGTGNFNTVSGITNSNIVFGGDGIANLNNGLTGNVTTNSAGTGTLNLVGSNNQAVNGNVGVKLGHVYEGGLRVIKTNKFL